MTQPEEEENGTGGSTKQGGRPNAFWARVREEQIESEEKGDTYGGAYRGVPAPKRGGQQTVKPDDTIGAVTRCWCGQPVNHDWPGKAGGAKHPKMNGDTMPNTATGLDRRDLRAWSRVLQDFILHCVNGKGLKYRVTNNSLILYPKDGTTPMTIAARNSDRQIRQLERWYKEHVEEPEPEKAEVTDADLQKLIEAKTDPIEHPTKQQPQYQEEPAKPEEYLPPVVETHAETVSTNQTDAVWKAYQYQDGNESTHIITDGTNLRCIICDNEGREYTITEPRSIGGHNRMWHTDSSTLRTPEARQKAAATRRRKIMEGSNVVKAIDLLIEASGYNPNPADDRIEELETALAAANKRADDAEAKLALIREATGL